jgi:hypothetical protein
MNDATDQGPLSGEARDAISNYLRKRDGSQMVSTSDTILYLRARFPSLETSRGPLTDIVAGEAIVLGVDVELDSNHRGRRALFDRWPRSAANNNVR